MKARKQVVGDNPGALDFLSKLFSIAPKKEVVIRGVPPGVTYIVNTSSMNLPVMDDKHNWYFSVCPREHGNDKPTVATAVWCDIDGVEAMPETHFDLAKPSMVVNTGHGVHAYWMLEEPTPVAEVSKLVKLAQLVLDGDKKAMDNTRLLRIPGTVNVKKKPFVPCELDEASDFKRYSFTQIEEALLAALVGDAWEEGMRNQVVLGFSALMARAGFGVERAIRVIKAVCRVTKDTEEKNRVSNVRGTYQKHEAGEVTTLKEFADLIGGPKFKALVSILGYDVSDGEVKYNGQVIGNSVTIQQDLVNMLIGDHCEWGWSEGQLIKWNGKVWVPEEKASLTADVFRVMDKLTVVKGSIEKKLPAKTGIAEGVSRIMTGNFASNQLEPHDPDIIGLNNGTLDLRTGEFREACKEDRLKKLLPVDYDPTATCPSWIDFLNEAAPEEANFLQEYVGYCLRPGNYFQRMLWVYGPSNTGKSTFLVTIYNMFGPTAVTLSSQNISQYQIASLTDAYLAVCTELTAQRFRTGAFKSLVSGDPVLARHPYGRPFSVEFRGKIMWGSNSLPTVDEAEGMWRRLVIIRFDNLPKKLDTTLIPRLREKELSGIFNWAYEGHRRVREFAVEGSWAIPDSSVETVASYRQYADIFEVFITEEMVRGDRFKVSVKEAFVRYAEFAKALGHGAPEFGAHWVEEFHRRGYEIIDNGMTIAGVKMSEMNNLSWQFKEPR